MKPAALSLITAVLMSVATQYVSYAAQRSTDTNVTVMSRGEVDATQLKAESYAYVTYRSGGKEEVVWGRIVQIDPDGIVIESETTPSEMRKIAVGDIDILAASEDRLSFESWLDSRLAAEKITVMTREDLDLKKLATGSYAHVVYTGRSLKRKASGAVVAIDPNGVSIRSEADPPESSTIAAAEIDTLAFANSLQAVKRWQQWAESGIVQMSRWDLSTSMLKEGLYVHVVYISHRRKRRVVGRIVDTYGDSVVIQYRVGGKATWAHNENLEVAYRDVENVILARERRDLQTLGPARTYFGYSKEHKVEGHPRVALKLFLGTVFGTLTAATAALSHYPELYRDNPGPPLEVIPATILHAAATAWVVNKVDPLARYGPTFAGSLLGCTAVSSAVLLSDLDGYEAPVVACLGYMSVTTLAATIASEISRGPPDEPGFRSALRRGETVACPLSRRFDFSQGPICHSTRR